jgi:hypothetical protein
MSDINYLNFFVLPKMTWQMVWTSCMYIEFILVNINYIVIDDMLSDLLWNMSCIVAVLTLLQWFIESQIEAIARTGHYETERILWQDKYFMSWKIDRNIHAEPVKSVD